MAQVWCWSCAAGKHQDCERRAKRKRDSDFVLEVSNPRYKYVKYDNYVRCDCLARRWHG